VLALLRTNQFVGNGLLVFYLLVARFPFYISPQYSEYEFQGGLAWEYVQQLGWTNPGFLNLLLAALFALATAIGLNILENKHRLTGELNLLPGAMFILLSSIFPSFKVLNPALLALPFVIYVLYSLILTYKDPWPAKKLFNMGFWLAVAGLFYPSIFWFIGFVLVGLSIMRAFRLKEVLMIFSGWLTLLFLVAVYCFWNDQLDHFFTVQFKQAISWMDWRLDRSLSAIWLPFGLLILIFGWGLISFSKFQLKKSILAKKAISVVFIYMLFTGITFILQPLGDTNHLLLLFPGLAYVLSLELLGMKSSWAEIAHLLLLFVICTYQFFF